MASAWRACCHRHCHFYGRFGPTPSRSQTSRQRKWRAGRLRQWRLRRTCRLRERHGSHQRWQIPNARIWHHRRAKRRTDRPLLRRHYPCLRRTPRLVTYQKGNIPMGKLFEELKNLLDQEKGVAQATVVRGPAHVGAKLLVLPGKESEGTLGNSQLDAL